MQTPNASCHNQVVNDWDPDSRSLVQVIVEAGLLALITLVALVGNSCVLYVFYKTPSLRNITSYYIITLAISDVVMSVAIMPSSTKIIAIGREAHSHIISQIQAFLAYCLIFGSLQTTSLIAINRFFCVVKRSLYVKYFTPKRAMLMIFGVWVFSVFFVAVSYFSGFVSLKLNRKAFLHLPHFDNQGIGRRLYGAASNIILVIFPLSITLVCYWKIFQTVKNHNLTVSSNLNVGPSGIASTLSKEELHITFSVLAVVCGFVFCWIPSATVTHISVYINLPHSVMLLIIYPMYASSAVNPIIYNTFNRPFRKAFLAILRSYFCKKRLVITTAGAKTTKNLKD